MARLPLFNVQRLTALLRSRAPVGVTELAAAMGVKRTTVQHRLAGLGPDLVKMGASRRICYALRRSLRDLGNQWPIWRIDERGNACEWVRLEAFHDRLWRVAWPTWAPAWARHFSNPEGLWQGFPFFLADGRPQGFLGQAIARNCSRSLQVPEDLQQWGDDDTVAFMHHEGVDLPGNLVCGGDCLQQALARIQVPTRDEEPSYAQRAAQAAERMPGTSVGGVQPKFAVATLAPDGAVRHLLVKFSPTLDQATGRRWADLLLAEAHAHAVLAGAGLALPGTRVLDQGGRRFLEVPRFDRTAGGGRLGTVSLAALHSAAVGVPHRGWTAAVEALRQAHLTDKRAVKTARRLETFGGLIGNTDMHAGNLSFWLDSRLPFQVAPAYDMLPMLWAPGPQGELSKRRFAPPAPSATLREEWQEVAGWAEAFWRGLLDEPRLSREFAGLAESALATVVAMSGTRGR